MKTFFRIIFLLAIVAVVVYYRGPVEKAIQDLFIETREMVFPCQNPINYSLGSFDAKFNISKTEFLKMMDEAALIWEKPIDKDLFAYLPAQAGLETGALKVNLVYDYRQETTDRLKSLGVVIKDDRTTYDELKTKYSSFLFVYNQQKAAFEQMVAEYNTQKDAYEREVRSWNKKGGAPKNVYDDLNRQKEQLDALAGKIELEQEKINELVNNLNAIVNNLNIVAAKLNLSVDNYNYVGSGAEKQFEEGLYERDANGERITIYQFDSRLALLRVLAHELGHALGLDHTDNPNDIMYKLNEGSNEKLTANDLAQLKAKCGIK